MSASPDTAVLARHDYWVFDMDGTLTVAVHDFDAIRQRLGLSPGVPILETLDAMPTERSGPLYRQLDQLELEYARAATVQEGAVHLLSGLHSRGAKLAVLTRNSQALAAITLRACGLCGFFAPEFVLGREGAPPKPSPAGIQLLMSRWNASPKETVMVGDFGFDIEAGARAGCTTVYYDPARSGAWTQAATHTVYSHTELLNLASI